MPLPLVNDFQQGLGNALDTGAYPIDDLLQQ